MREIRKFILAIVMMAATLTSLTACLGDDVEVVYYDDAAITSFTLGTLNRTMHTKSKAGLDSTYVKSVSCSNYVFQINQQLGEIWNADSLPLGIDAKRVICTINAKNGGSIALQNIDSDTLNAYNSADSIDFSQPRKFHVFSNSMQGKRVYTVKVNVHQSEPDTCLWTRMVAENAEIGALTDMKAVTLGNTLLLYGNAGGESKVYSTDINDGISWKALTTSIALDAEASKSIVQKGSMLYTISGGKVLSSEDGGTWTEICATTNRKLVAASTVRLYALSADGKLMSSVNGADWTEETLDDDAAQLPTEGVAYVAKPSQTNADTDRIMIIGNRSLETYPDDITAKVWTKIDEYSDGARPAAWNYVAFQPHNKFKAPRAKNWQIINYDGENIKAICGKGEGASENAPLAQIYNSVDNGITWQKDKKMYLPAAMKSSDSEFAMVKDANNMVWIICGETGQVWKGRINRVAWEK